MATGSRKPLPWDEELGNTPFTPRSLLILAVALVCVIGLMAGVYSLRFSRIGVYHTEYSGSVVEKIAGYHETELGSKPYFRLLIEDDSKTRFVVDVDDVTYNKARRGMKITKDYKGALSLE